MATSSGTGLGSYVSYYGNDQNSDEEHLRKILRDIFQVLKMDEFDKDLQDSLQRDHPNYLEILDKLEKDLLRKDCAIIFTGETSAGKSSLINLLLKTDILPEGMEATTKVICKIKHSEHKVIKVFSRDGKLLDAIKEEEKTDKSYDETSSDFVESFNDDNDIDLQRCLEETGDTESPSMEVASMNVRDAMENDNDIYSILENLFESASRSAPDIHYIEIHHPMRLLEKGNITIVDSPGVGDCDKLNEILEEYLPYAVAFVFVVNPTSGGGMQEDRILKVMKSIKAKTDTMICFEPADVIFAVNKWDAMFGKARSSTEKQWRDVVDKIKKSWPNVNTDNIIKMSVKLAFTGDETYSDNFSCFEKTLHSLVEKNINKRIKNSHRFLADILGKVEIFINSRIFAADRSLPELKEETEKCLGRLKKLEGKSRKTSEICIEILENTLVKHGEQLLSFIRSEEFKDHVLYPDSTLERTSRPWIGTLISTRMQDAISSWIEQNESKLSSELDDTIESKFHEIHNELEEIIGKVGCASKNYGIRLILDTIFSEALKSPLYGFGFGFLSFTILAPLCNVQVCAAGAAVAMVLSYNYAKGVSETLKLSRNQVIEESFLTRRNAITQKTVAKILINKYRDQYRSILNGLFCKIIPTEIKKGERLLKNLENDYASLLLKKAALVKLSSEFAKIRNSLQRCHFLDTMV